MRATEAAIRQQEYPAAVPALPLDQLVEQLKNNPDLAKELARQLAPLLLTAA